MQPIRCRFPALILGLVIIGAIPACSLAQALYSYVDERGIPVYTNIPPQKPVRDLKVTGVPAPPSPSPGLSPMTPYDPIILKYAEKYQLDPALIRSMIDTESGFNPKAVSNKGAQGLMQLMPATATRLGVRNAFDPEENIRGGVKHMRGLMDTFKNDLNLSLAAYNAGENLVQRIGKVPNIPETHNYVRSITKKLAKKDSANQSTSIPQVPSTYRYVDEKGVLHLTNIPPVMRSDFDFPIVLAPAQSPQ